MVPRPRVRSLSSSPARAALALAFTIAGCKTSGGGAGGAAPNAPSSASEISAPSSELKISSPAFPAMGSIPKSYTCEGSDTSPPLEWSGVPSGTKSLALVVDDPDAPDPAAPTRVFVHWVVYDLPPDSKGLAENAASSGLPNGAVGGKNDWGKTTFGGPCPPIGRHRYFHTLFALDKPIGLPAATKSELEGAMHGHVLGKAVLIGTYEKGK